MRFRASSSSAEGRAADRRGQAVAEDGAPELARPRATAAPIPLPAPVTMAETVSAAGVRTPAFADAPDAAAVRAFADTQRRTCCPARRW
ncbi:hypothetical protein ACWD7C_33565 [Streptomyces sp. NPDC005134]|uniref:hypothetical protein n=1 Tax=Streptomyces sp. NPDC005098 TaxID=3154560 RepID=UPI0033AB766C